MCERQTGTGTCRGPIITQIFSGALNLTTCNTVERLEKEHPFDQRCRVEPERVSTREMRQFVREQAALLIWFKLGQYRDRHADLTKTECHRTRDRIHRCQRHRRPMAGTATQRVEHVGKCSIGNGATVRQSADKHQPTGEVIRSQQQCE